jgi:hypothetical protein
MNHVAVIVAKFNIRFVFKRLCFSFCVLSLSKKLCFGYNGKHFRCLTLHIIIRKLKKKKGAAR